MVKDISSNLIIGSIICGSRVQVPNSPPIEDEAKKHLFKNDFFTEEANPASLRRIGGTGRRASLRN